MNGCECVVYSETRPYPLTLATHAYIHTLDCFYLIFLVSLLLFGSFFFLFVAEKCFMVGWFVLHGLLRFIIPFPTDGLQRDRECVRVYYILMFYSTLMFISSRTAYSGFLNGYLSVLSCYIFSCSGVRR